VQVDAAPISAMPLPPAPAQIRQAGGHDDIAPCIESEFLRWRRVGLELLAIEANDAIFHGAAENCRATSRSQAESHRNFWDRFIEWVING